MPGVLAVESLEQDGDTGTYLVVVFVGIRSLDFFERQIPGVLGLVVAFFFLLSLVLTMHLVAFWFGKLELAQEMHTWKEKEAMRD